MISAGKKGDVCLIDIRSKNIRHKFNAHESPVKCIAIDPHEDYFATGSADGDIKVNIAFTSISDHFQIENFPTVRIFANNNVIKDDRTKFSVVITIL